jgi:hypothetical protein
VTNNHISAGLNGPAAEEQAFLRAAQTGTITERLLAFSVYADFLDERGRTESARAWRWCGANGYYPRSSGRFRRWGWYRRRRYAEEPVETTDDPAYRSTLPAVLYDLVRVGGRKDDMLRFRSLAAAVEAVGPELAEMVRTIESPRTKQV